MSQEDSSIVHDVSLAAAVGRRALPMRLCTAFIRSLGAQHATMSLLPSLERWQLLYASDEAALRAEAAQFAHAEGPSISAALGRRTVIRAVDDDGAGDHPPCWSNGLSGLRHVLALALHHRQSQPVGVICLYFTRTTALTQTDVRQAEQAAALTREELLRWRPVHANAAGQRPVWATDTRAARWERIHQAAASIAAREDCPLSEGLAWLQKTSMRRQRSLLDICDDILQPAAAGPDLQAAPPGLSRRHLL